MSESRQSKWGLAILVAGGVLLLISILTSWMVRWTGGGWMPGQIASTPALLVQVQSLSELVTVKYLVEKVVKLESEPSLLGRDRVILLVHAVVKAGVDLSLLKPEDVKVSGTKVTLRLPAAKIMDAYIDEKRTEVWEHSTAFWRPMDKDLEQNARMQAMEQIRLAAGEQGIQKEANQQAQRQLKLLLQTFGFTEVEFQNP